MAAAKIRDTDKGFQAFLERAREASKGAGVSVGVHAAEGAEAEEGGLTVLDVAIFNEFGLGVPERSFLRAWIDENTAVNTELLRRAAVMALKGGKTLPQALELLGMKFAGGIQSRIAQGISPANAPATIAKKGSSTPLIETGQLRQAITHLVRDKEPPT